MRGWGSGRRLGAKCTEDCSSIDVRRWQREGYLVPGKCFRWQWTWVGDAVTTIDVKVEAGQLRLMYTWCRPGEPWENLDYPVKLQTTSCHYGGVRYWLTCPVAGCGRRVAILYLGDQLFACRQCYRLAYKSQREAREDRMARKANKVRAQLSWPSGIFNPNGNKPKGMHWKTYYRLLAKHNEYSDRALMGIAGKFRAMNTRFDDK